MTKESNIYKSILAVQQAAPMIDKSATNPHFKSKYADLPEIWKSIKDIMGKNNLLVSHTLEANGDEYIVTRIIHVETGESIESRSRIMLQKSTAQEYGSYITYMRRYALSAMLGLVTDEDDDGQAASQKQNKASANNTQKKPTAADEMKKKMKEIAASFEVCENIDDLEKCWNENEKIINEVKKQSPDKGYSYLLKSYKNTEDKLAPF